MIQLLFNGMLAVLLANWALNDIPHAVGLLANPEPGARWIPPEEKYRLVKRTKRGSLVVIQREGDKAIIEVPNLEDMLDISKLLNASGIKWDMRSGISKSAWEGTPAHLRGSRGVGKGYPGYTVMFNFSDLEKVIGGRILQPLMLED